MANRSSPEFQRLPFSAVPEAEGLYDAGPWFALAAASALAGAFVERWLFFAEARHLVTLYY